MEIFLRGEGGIRLPRKFLIQTAQKLLQKLACKPNLELSIMFVGDDSIRDMNRRYRGKDCPTDILSFTKPLGFKCPDRNYMGDIVISIDTARKNAKVDGKSLKEELVLLLTHGILHLCGYDHEGVSEYRSKKMMKKQKELLEEIMVWKG